LPDQAGCCLELEARTFGASATTTMVYTEYTWIFVCGIFVSVSLSCFLMARCSRSRRQPLQLSSQLTKPRPCLQLFVAFGKGGLQN